MLDSQKLIDLNFQGFCPGPDEDEQKFLQRVKLTEKLILTPEQVLHTQKIPFLIDKEHKVKKPSLSWINATLMHLYGFYKENLPAYFSNQRLSFFEGAATFFIKIDEHELPVLLLRKELKKKQGFLGFFYSLEEILAHEAVHFLRSSFLEDQFEEFFAYLTSKHFLRKMFGPMIKSSREIYIFFGLLLTSLIFEFSFLLFPCVLLKSLFFMSASLPLAFLAAGLFRMIKLRKVFNRCLKNLKQAVAEKALHLMVRLTDQEIFFIAQNCKTKKVVQDYAFEKKKKSLRWKMLFSAYFS